MWRLTLWTILFCIRRAAHAGLHSVITEWDVDLLSVAATADSYGGAVWCLAVSTASDTLAAGCEDGCIKL